MTFQHDLPACKNPNDQTIAFSLCHHQKHVFLDPLSIAKTSSCSNMEADRTQPNANIHNIPVGKQTMAIPGHM